MRWRVSSIVLALALVASITIGLLGLWPDVRGASQADRRKTARVSSAVDDELERQRVGTWLVSRVRLGYLPHRALVEVQALSTGRRFCLLVARDFGHRVDREDLVPTACDF